MCLDEEKVNETYNSIVAELNDSEEELDKFTGGLNPRSNKQMSEFIYDTLKFQEPKDTTGTVLRTPKGERTASSIAISLLKPKNKRQRKFIELKQKQAKLNAQVTKSLEKFYKCCEEGDGILYASINQTVTATGRYSSTGKEYKCQFQNVDREFKSLFRARNSGWMVGEADEAQLEFRVAVWYGQDDQGFQDIQSNVDVHSYTSRIIGCSRQTAKAHTFKPLYGGTSGTASEKRYYKAFKEKYSKIDKEQSRWVDNALINKQIELPTGMKFYFPSLRVTESGYIEGNTSVRNYPVQYLATAEIVPMALVYAWHSFKINNAKSFIVNTIHDSIICEVHPEELNFFRETMSKALRTFPVEYMEKIYGIDFNVPLEAEIKTGTHWGL
jgi:DNA polymerase I-like protein with 3'-5' exonuclease and polymerase domains